MVTENKSDRLNTSSVSGPLVIQELEIQQEINRVVASIIEVGNEASTLSQVQVK